MGGSGIVCVTTWVCGVAVRITRFVVTTRRTRFTGLRAAWRLRTIFLPLQGEQDWTVCARAFGTSAICIAPLPMIAPPHVQAQSLARAIRTDIGFSFFPVAGAKRHRPTPPVHLSLYRKRPKLCERGNCVNRVCLSDSGNWDAESTKIALSVPKQNGNFNNSMRLVNLRT